eukprot:17845-Heterococcus_DN1.PRE.8
MVTSEAGAQDGLLKFASLGRGDDPAAVAPMNVAWDLLQAGFTLAEEPYLRGLMEALKQSVLKDVKQKHRIVAPDAV